VALFDPRYLEKWDIRRKDAAVLLLVLPHEVAGIGPICISFQIELPMRSDRRGAQILPREREINDEAGTNEGLGSEDLPPQYTPNRTSKGAAGLARRNLVVKVSQSDT